MNHTVVVDEDYRSRRLENRLNAAVRHCRIGNVKEKEQAATIEFVPTLPVQIIPQFNEIPQIQWWQYGQQVGPKCSCKPGQACGNAACPYALIATS